MIPGTILLAGVVGSTAYGLDTAESDIDRLGVFAAPTVAFHGLHRPKESHVTVHPDATYHEAAKWIRLALGGNPTAMELVWLDSYEACTPLGEELIGLRSSLLSAQRVKDAYLGYATQQFRRLENRGDGSFSADTRKRTAKHARHLWRLVHQGTGLNTCGKLTVRLDSAQAALCREFGERVAAGDIAVAQDYLASAEQHFREHRSVLPAEPDERAAGEWLLRVRGVMAFPGPGPAGRHPSSWREAPDCGRCNGTGRFRETACRIWDDGTHSPITVEAHCTCKRGQRMSELWQAEKHGYSHPDMPDPEPPDAEGPPF